MPDYKRKKIRRGIGGKRKSAHNTFKNNDIIMRSTDKKSSAIVPDDNIKVVRGAKLKRKRKVKVLLSVAAVLCVAFLVLSVVLPVSVYENVVNTVSLMGHGSYPIKISGTNILDKISNGTHYYVLTDTNITAYSNNGKIAFSEQHGFTNPIMSVTDTRVLVFDQGGNQLYVYNLSGKIYERETKQGIINATVCRSGSFAVATSSDEYTSTAEVFDKNNKQVYKWNSAKDIISNVLLDNSGKKLAVSTVNAVSGSFSSKVSVLDFESADPLFTMDLGDSLALSLNNSSNGFSVITKDKYRFVKWSKFETKEISAQGEINILSSDKSGTLLVTNRANDRSDNTIMVISKKGEKISEFKINKIITDIEYRNSRVYYISDTTVNLLDKKGNLLCSDSCSFTTDGFTIVGANAIAVISDNQIIKTDIKKGE